MKDVRVIAIQPDYLATPFTSRATALVTSLAATVAFSIALAGCCAQTPIRCYSQITLFLDRDGDGFGDPETEASSCSVIDNAEYDDAVSEGGDCDDQDANVSPEALEICNEVDDDCDTFIDTLDDDVQGTVHWYLEDQDQDGYGAADSEVLSCTQPTPDAIDQGGDCLDSNGDIHPGAPEICNGIDDDCDGLIDDSDPNASPDILWYQDSDHDGYGADATATASCTPPPDSADNNTDCNDSDSAIHPGVLDVCDNVDNDCDGAIDEDPPTWYQDLDGDGYGTANVTAAQCSQPSGFVSDNGDCNDLKASIHPNAPESCNQLDENCDNTPDDGVSITAVSAGSSHVLALCSSGEVLAWGDNNRGQLGDATTTQRSTPGLVLNLGNIRAIAAGTEFSLALDKDGVVWGWGSDARGQLGNGEDVGSVTVPGAVILPGPMAGIAAGTGHGLAFSATGALYTWGENAEGQLCIGDSGGFERTPLQVNATQDGTLISAIGLAAGEFHSLVLMSNRAVWSCGNDNNGQLGNDGGSSAFLVPVVGLASVTGLSAGALHSLAVTGSTDFAWGSNDDGQLGDGSGSDQDAPIQVGGTLTFLHLSGGGHHSLGVDAVGDVWGWGRNNQGQASPGSGTADLTAPTIVEGLESPVVAVSAGEDFSVAIDNQGSVWAWGNNDSGQLGVGHKDPVTAPIKTKGLP